MDTPTIFSGFSPSGGNYESYNTWNNSGPLVYLSWRTSAFPSPRQYFVANCGNGAIVTLSRNGAAPQSTTSLGTLDLSPNGRWAAFTSRANSAAVADLFAMAADGSTEPANQNLAGAALGSTQVSVSLASSPLHLLTTLCLQGFSAYKFTSDSKYLTAVRVDSNAANTRTTLINALMQLPLEKSQINLTPAYANFPNGDPLATFVPPTSFSNYAFLYTMQWPNAIAINTSAASNTALYAIAQSGGDTVQLSANNTNGFNVNAWQAASFSFRAFWFNDAQAGTVRTFFGGDAYVNYALASSLLPCVFGLVVLLAVAL